MKARITIHPKFKIGDISERLYSAFLEPIGTMVNGFMYNPKHPTADEQGFRQDVIKKLSQTGLAAVRMPGGNFVSAWQWKDSIGPRENRKVHLDPAWYQYIPNDVGHDEYLQWAEKVGTSPIYTVNLGTGTLQDAMDCVEYTNHEGGTYWSDLRRQNGHAAPYGVKTWCLGNEMDGHWQLGSWEKDPVGYGNLCHEASKAMKWIDASIETVACASSASFMDHYPEWEAKVMDQCYDTVDYLALHHYHIAKPGDILSLLGGSLYYEDFINTETAMLDYIQAKHRSPRKVNISFDEYGAFERPFSPLNPGYGPYNMARSHYKFDPERKYILHDPNNMPERDFPGGDMIKLLGMASIQLAMLRHADRVKISCMTGGLGALCSSNRDTVWNSASHYAFMQMIKYARGTSMQVNVDSETYDMPGYAIDDTSQYTGKNNVNYIDSACAWDKANNRLTVFVINRNLTETYPLEIDLRGFNEEGYTQATLYQMYSDDFEAKSFFDKEWTEPTRSTVTIDKGIAFNNIHPLSWNVFVFERKKS